jgi:hypothetical protein
MLGRLEMTVDQCITAYDKLAEEVFSEKLRSSPFDMKGRLKARFDAAKLERAILKVMEQGGALKDDLLNDEVERGCKT